MDSHFGYVGVDRAEGVVLRLGHLGSSERVEERRFSNVRVPDDATGGGQGEGTGGGVQKGSLMFQEKM